VIDPKVAVIRGSPIDGNEAGVVVVIAEIVFLVGKTRSPYLTMT